MGGEQTCVQPQLQHWLSGLGFYHLSSDRTGCTYHRQVDDTSLVIDTGICNLADYPYVAYTSSQNALMAGHGRMFRFLLEPDTSVAALQQNIRIFLEEEADPVYRLCPLWQLRKICH